VVLAVSVRTEDRVKITLVVNGKKRKVRVKKNTPLPAVYDDLKAELFAPSDAVVLQPITTLYLYYNGSVVGAVPISTKTYDSQTYTCTFTAQYNATSQVTVDELRLGHPAKGLARQYYSVQISPLTIPAGGSLRVQWTVRWFMGVLSAGGILSTATQYIQGLLLAIVMRLAGQFSSSLRIAGVVAYYAGSQVLSLTPNVDASNLNVSVSSYTFSQQATVQEVYLVNSSGYKLIGFILPNPITFNPGDQLSLVFTFNIT
jgi:hypothetical protein